MSYLLSISHGKGANFGDVFGLGFLFLMGKEEQWWELESK